VAPVGGTEGSVSTKCTQSTPAALDVAVRALAVTRAKAVAFRFVTAVRQRDSRMVRAVADGMSEHEMTALAIVLAECADITRLKIVKEAGDDGLPDITGRSRAAARSDQELTEEMTASA